MLFRSDLSITLEILPDYPQAGIKNGTVDRADLAGAGAAAIRLEEMVVKTVPAAGAALGGYRVEPIENAQNFAQEKRILSCGSDPLAQKFN